MDDYGCFILDYLSHCILDILVCFFSHFQGRLPLVKHYDDCDVRCVIPQEDNDSSYHHVTEYYR